MISKNIKKITNSYIKNNNQKNILSGMFYAVEKRNVPLFNYLLRHCREIYIKNNGLDLLSYCLVNNNKVFIDILVNNNYKLKHSLKCLGVKDFFYFVDKPLLKNFLSSISNKKLLGAKNNHWIFDINEVDKIMLVINEMIKRGIDLKNITNMRKQEDVFSFYIELPTISQFLINYFLEKQDFIYIKQAIENKKQKSESKEICLLESILFAYEEKQKMNSAIIEINNKKATIKI